MATPEYHNSHAVKHFTVPSSCLDHFVSLPISSSVTDILALGDVPRISAHPKGPKQIRQRRRIQHKKPTGGTDHKDNTPSTANSDKPEKPDDGSTQNAGGYGGHIPSELMIDQPIMANGSGTNHYRNRQSRGDRSSEDRSRAKKADVNKDNNSANGNPDDKIPVLRKAVRGQGH